MRPAVKALRRSGDRELSDERILARGEFVERIIKEAEAQIKYQLPVLKDHHKIDEFISGYIKNYKTGESISQFSQQRLQLYYEHDSGLIRC